MVIHTPALHWIPGIALLLCQAQGRLALCSIKTLQEKTHFKQLFKVQSLLWSFNEDTEQFPFPDHNSGPDGRAGHGKPLIFPCRKERMVQGDGKGKVLE